MSIVLLLIGTGRRDSRTLAAEVGTELTVVAKGGRRTNRGRAWSVVMHIPVLQTHQLGQGSVHRVVALHLERVKVVRIREIKEMGEKLIREFLNRFIS